MRRWQLAESDSGGGDEGTRGRGARRLTGAAGLTQSSGATRHFHWVIYSVSNEAENYFIRGRVLNACLLRKCSCFELQSWWREVCGARYKYLVIIVKFHRSRGFRLQHKPNAFYFVESVRIMPSLLVTSLLLFIPDRILVWYQPKNTYWILSDCRVKVMQVHFNKLKYDGKVSSC